jgi:hemoglobin
MHPAQTGDTLYDQLGRDGGLEAVVEELYRRVLPDPLLAPYFAHLDGDARRRLRRHMTAFLAAATGGPDRYQGRELDRAHAGLGVTAVAFERVAAHLDDALRHCGVDDAKRAAILGAVAPLRPLIVDGGPG